MISSSNKNKKQLLTEQIYKPNIKKSCLDNNLFVDPKLNLYIMKKDKKIKYTYC